MFVAKPRILSIALLLGLILCIAGQSPGQPAGERALPSAATRVDALLRQSQELADRIRANQTPLYEALKSRVDGPQGALNATENLLLKGIVNGRPRYYQTTNLFAARSVGTDNLWPGGATGLNLDGTNLAGELAVWDAGQVRLTHREFGGRVVQNDNAAVINYHATHVAGTLVAAGIAPLAQGMSYAAFLDSYDWSFDDAEMAQAAAAGLLVSNHSYANVTGWIYIGGDIPWYWYGDPLLSETEDAGFGYYGPESQGWDQIAYDAPNYLIVKAAANDRDDYGPLDGAEHYVWDAGAGEWIVSTTTRIRDGGLDGYDSIPYKGTAKNVLTVGAVWDVDGGYSQPSDALMTLFSGWGPTDDGRIKPDLVANGMGLYSCYSTSDSAYAALSGTSMAAPNATGSLHLLAQLWKDLNGGQPARGATLKGIAVHTASETGTDPGPDYSFGWGLLDAEEAGLLIADRAVFPDRVRESYLADAAADTVLLWSAGVDPVAVTICWMDPAAAASPWSLNDPSPKLVNDLDLRLETGDGATVYQPWVLDPANPSLPAATGDNFRDNIEKIDVGAPAAGLYRVIVTHKGSLVDGGQAYSLVTSGLGEEVHLPEVANVTFSQRTNGSGLVDIYYDVADQDTPTVAVSLEASGDGGATWTLSAATLSGDIGPAVPVGPGKTIVWNFAADHPGVFLPNVVVRVTALD